MSLLALCPFVPFSAIVYSGKLVFEIVDDCGDDTDFLDEGG